MKSTLRLTISLLKLLVLFHVVALVASHSSFNPLKDDNFNEDSCFCQLKGTIEDCSCQIDTVDRYNNYQIHPRLQSLLAKDYFRYFEVNLRRDCPFWTDDGSCSAEFCQVKTCQEHEVPVGIKGARTKPLDVTSDMKQSKTKVENSCKDEEQDLGYLNTTISESSRQEFEKWKQYDEALTDFCSNRDDEDDPDSQFVDLSLNPERYTGYRGPSAHKIWHAVYKENCFKDLENDSIHPLAAKSMESCIERRTFFRAISGLHSSINIHLSAKYLKKGSKNGVPFNKIEDDGKVWGPNESEFRYHFDKPEATSGAYTWLKNLYFVYLIELKAIAKAVPFLSSFDLYTGNLEEDTDMKLAMNDFLSTVASFPSHFEEASLFSGKDAKSLKREFHDRFTNITKIMDCVGCQKCKLWGKLQVKGLGTALRILFSSSPNKLSVSFLSRNEIVALVNAFGRLSESIYQLDNFRKIIKTGVMQHPEPQRSLNEEL